MRVAIYARVSTTDQHCEVQLGELREYCKRRGWKKPLEYVDQGFSGAKASRPALDKLMKDASERQFDCLLVWKIDRFGRSVLNLSTLIHQLDEYGVRFIATTQGIDTDVSSPTSRLLLNILASVAEFEREIMRERTRAGLMRARELGKQLGRPQKVFRRGQIADLRSAGLSWRAIAKRLNVSLTTVFDAGPDRSENPRQKQRSENPSQAKPAPKPKQRT